MVKRPENAKGEEWQNMLNEIKKLAEKRTEEHDKDVCDWCGYRVKNRCTSKDDWNQCDL